MKYDDTFAPFAAKFPHTAGQHDELLDGAELKAVMKTIVGFSLESYAAGDKVWGRRASHAGILPRHGLGSGTIQSRRNRGREGGTICDHGADVVAANRGAYN